MKDRILPLKAQGTDSFMKKLLEAKTSKST